MSKRLFRRATANPKVDRAPDYPTLDGFDSTRRQFLARLGAGLLGAGAIAGALSACGDGRSVGGQPDSRPIDPPDGVAPMPDARVDTKTPGPDGPINMGGAPMMDAHIDKPDAGPPKADMQPPSPGFAPPMDARVDQDKPVKLDFGGLSGAAPAMDARVDDGGSCPNP